MKGTRNQRVAAEKITVRNPWCPLAGLALGAVWWLVSAGPLLVQMLRRFRSGQGVGWLATTYSITWRTPSEIVRDLVYGQPMVGGSAWVAAAAIVAMSILVVGGLPRVGEGIRQGRVSGVDFRRLLPAALALGLIGFPALVSLYKVIILGGQRYLAIALPPMCLAAGLGLHGLLLRRGTAKGIGVVSAGVVLVAQLTYLAVYYGGREKRMWREAVAFVEPDARPGDVITAIPGYSLWVVEHYATGPEKPVAIETLASMDRQPERVWVLSISPVASPEERDLVKTGWRMGGSQSVADRSSATYVRVTRYDRRTGR